ncbi:phosphate/phosphite/phosphonate ABC transporter substrate-binding protein [Desulfopila sp. IMCC35006]|uniref:phosphate/phosphite/phosphonate ABC transporter substrate-binding protein n=1 Tax=Desulfopila sp. IMCC35006 TaxID=2569542 RepID=UPI00142F265C|nr:PhnD/SsuA/transferrin family substrate-binding protein [Desulfopila sp. IMCC35006]
MSTARNPQSLKPGAVIQLACSGIVICLLLAVLLRATPAGAAVESNADMPKLFRAGFLQSVFTNIDPKDARVVLELYCQNIADELQFNVDYKVVMFDSLELMVDAVRQGALELVSIPSIEYLNIRKTIPLIPAFVGTNGTSQGKDYVIITRKDSGIHSFSDLRDKSMMLPSVTTYEPAHLWLEVMLLKAGKGARDVFFSQVKEAPKMTKAIMAVFFRQADAAIVTGAGLEISQQLNPQLAVQLTVLAESPNLGDFVTCMNPNTSERFRDKLSKALVRLNESKSGQQLYLIFQTKGIIPFKPEYMEGLEGLLHERDRLTVKTISKK